MLECARIKVLEKILRLPSKKVSNTFGWDIREGLVKDLSFDKSFESWSCCFGRSGERRMICKGRKMHSKQREQ